MSRLTGKTRYRTSRLPFSSKLVLQVEERFRMKDEMGIPNGPTKTRWRDAKPQDLTDRRIKL